MRPTKAEVKAIERAGWNWKECGDEIYVYINDKENGWYEFYFKPDRLDEALEDEIDELSEDDVVYELVNENSDQAILDTVHSWKALYRLQECLRRFSK